LNYELLADVAQVIIGQSPPSSTYNTVGDGLPFYQGKTDFGDMYPTPRVYCTEPSRIAEAGDILISVRAPVGPTNVSQERSCIGRGISAIRVGKNLDRDFLLYFLRFYEPELAKAGTGSTFSAISREDLETIKIPLPPLTEQKRIASLLARADRLRQLRRTAHDLGDALLQSVFLEMFGDPIANPNGWDKVVIEELVSDMRGGSPLEPEDFVDKGFPVLHKGAIKPWGEIELDPKKKTFTHDAFVQKYKRAVINRDYVVVTLRDLVPSGPSIGLVSKLTSSPYPEYILAQGAYAFLVNKKKLNADYLMALSNITSFRRFLRTLAVGSTQIHIRNPIYLEIAIPLPPITLQEKFSKVINQLQIVREQRYESERQIEILFQDLMNKVFAEGLNES